MISFGADGDEDMKAKDFEAVRGTAADNAFMKTVLADSMQAEEKGNVWISRLKELA